MKNKKMFTISTGFIAYTKNEKEARVIARKLGRMAKKEIKESGINYLKVYFWADVQEEDEAHIFGYDGMN